MRAKFPITKAQFGAFLKAHPRYKFVRGSGSDCPIARAIREIVPTKQQTRAKSEYHARPSRYVRAYPSATYFGDYTAITPIWAQDFIRTFDRSTGNALAVWESLGYK